MKKLAICQVRYNIRICLIHSNFASGFQPNLQNYLNLILINPVFSQHIVKLNYQSNDQRHH
jgi:hypothetical protein